MDPQTSPLAVLSMIVAPAVLTNASSVLAMSTTNRLARATDRARELARQLEQTPDFSSAETARRLRELTATEHRTMMLLSALRSFYFALGSFAAGTLFALLAAIVVPMNGDAAVRLLQFAGLAAGLLALSALVHGSMVLVRETRIVVRVLQERAASVRARVGKDADVPV